LIAANEPTRRLVIAPIVLQSKLVTQCDELATVVGRTKLTTLAMVDVPHQYFSKTRVWDNVPEGSALIFGDTWISL